MNDFTVPALGILVVQLVFLAVLLVTCPRYDEPQTEGDDE